jgi:hypothetical protein
MVDYLVAERKKYERACPHSRRAPLPHAGRRDVHAHSGRELSSCVASRQAGAEGTDLRYRRTLGGAGEAMSLGAAEERACDYDLIPPDLRSRVGDAALRAGRSL